MNRWLNPSWLTYQVVSRATRYRMRWYFRHIHPWLTPAHVELKMEDGQILHLQPKYDNLQASVYLDAGAYRYESHVIDWFNRNLHSGMSVMEIGAHIGFHAIQMCRLVGPQGTALLIEPDPHNFTQLTRNIADNNIHWARCINLAIDEQAGEIEFFSSFDGGRGSLIHNQLADRSSTHVQTVTVDHLLNEQQMQQVDLLLMDIEGAECKFPVSAAESLSQHRIRAIICEFHPQKIRDFGYDAEKFVQQIASHGYAVMTLNRRGEEIPYVSDPTLERSHLIFKVQ